MKRRCIAFVQDEFYPQYWKRCPALAETKSKWRTKYDGRFCRAHTVAYTGLFLGIVDLKPKKKGANG